MSNLIETLSGDKIKYTKSKNDLKNINLYKGSKSNLTSLTNILDLSANLIDNHIQNKILKSLNDTIESKLKVADQYPEITEEAIKVTKDIQNDIQEKLSLRKKLGIGGIVMLGLSLAVGIITHLSDIND